MAIIHMEDWKSYGSNLSYGLDGVYASYSYCKLDTDPISGGYVMRTLSTNEIAGYSDSELRWVNPKGTVRTIGVALRMYMASLPTTSYRRPAVVLKGASNSVICGISVNPTGYIQLWKGSPDASSPGTLQATSSVPVVIAGGWQHMEMKFYCNGVGASTFELRVEGVTISFDTTLTTVDLTSTPIAQVALASYYAVAGPAGDTHTTWFKDWVVWDLSGSHNVDFLGSVFVGTLTPNADVSLNWATTDANGYSILDNSPPNDAHYISADSSLPAASTFSMTDLPATVTSVKGLMTMVRAVKSDGGDGNLQNGIVSSSSTALGTDNPITVAPVYWRDIIEEDPDTSALWTPTAVNSIKLQVNRTL